VFKAVDRVDGKLVAIKVLQMDEDHDTSELVEPLLSALCSLLSALCSLLSALCSLLSALCSLLSALCFLLLFAALCALSECPSNNYLQRLFFDSTLSLLSVRCSTVHSSTVPLYSLLSALCSVCCSFPAALSSLLSALCSLLSALCSAVCSVLSVPFCCPMLFARCLYFFTVITMRIFLHYTFS
jgi:hypothetical protein